MQSPIQATVGPCAVSAALVTSVGEGVVLGPGAAEQSRKARSTRVLVLIVAIIALSLGDLVMTMTYLRSIGMGEANPLARYVIEYNSPALLVVWKSASILLASLIFLIYRHKRFTEAACWCCVLVLAWLTVRWWNYSSETCEIAQHIQSIATVSDSTNWVQLSQ